MGKSKAELAVAMLKETMDFKLDQIDFSEEACTIQPENFRLRVWSKESPTGAFFATKLCSIMADLFGLYLYWNEDQNRVELSIH